MNLLRFLGVQLLPVFGGGILVVFLPWLGHEPWQDRLSKLDDRTLFSIVQQLDEVSPGRAFFKDDLKSLESFLQLLTEATGHRLIEGRLFTRITEDGIIPIDYRLVVEGDPFDLPVLIEGVHRYRSVVSIQQLDVTHISQSICSTRIRLRMLRPDIPSEAWVNDLMLSNSIHRELLKTGWELWNWLYYLEKESRFDALALSYRDELFESLSPGLIHLRNNEGHMTWTPSTGLRPSE
jgi:hypothetical protein